MADEGPSSLETASTGVPELDGALERLNWGDNVVWEENEGASAEPFYRAIAALAAEYDFAGYVTLTRSPEEVRETYPGLAAIDARPRSALAQPGALMRAVREACSREGRCLFLFDPLEAMSDQWSADVAARFFTQGCPLLLDLGAIAYWSLTPGAHPARIRREVEQVTQCVIVIGDGRLRIAKAEGRPGGVQGSVFRYDVVAGRLSLSPAPAAARLGAALRALRLQRGLSQGDVARLGGVSASAVSQAERGLRGLSLETLLELTGRLGITLDELLRGEVAPGYRLARRHDPRVRSEGRPLPLFDDPHTGLRTFLVRLAPRATATAALPHKGVELVAVGSGLVQVVLGSGRPVLRAGEALLAERSTIEAFRNLSDGEATVFWILRDDAPPGGS